MNYIETHKGIRIYEDITDKDRPITTVQTNVPILGTMENGHKSIEDAKKFIDSLNSCPVS